MDNRSLSRQRGWFALATAVIMVYTAPAGAQVPTRIPSEPEAQIFNLIQRVTALEQKVAALSNAAGRSSGTTPTRVTAPFEVVDAAGRPIFQVVQFGTNMRMSTTGMVVTNEPTTGSSVLLTFNGRRQTVAALGSGPDGYGQLTLRDSRGHTQASVNGDGWDQAAAMSLTASYAFLTGDRSLEVAYGTSSTDASGVIRLSTIAVPRLAKAHTR
jgi:hypothetical protein